MKFGDKEIHVVLSLIRELIGHQFSIDNSVCIIQSLESRLIELNMSSLREYFRLLDQDPSELEKFIALSTVHTTSWFRDHEQLKNLEGWVHQELEAGRKKFRIWSAACSTGQEIYSVALILESLKAKGYQFEYSLVGSDIDRLSLLTAAKAEYPMRQFNQIPEMYLPYIVQEESSKGPVFRPYSKITEKVQFIQANLLGDLTTLGKFDMVLLRNVLFYFEPANQRQVIRSVEAQVDDNGLMCLGVSDLSDQSNFTLKSKGKSLYSREVRPERKLLVIDDSAIAQLKLREIFTKAGFTVEVASNIREAETKLKTLNICAITLDVNLGEENGLDWLAQQRRQSSPLVRRPVVIVSDLSKDQLDEGYDVIVAESPAYFEKSQLLQKSDDLISTIEELLKKPERRAPQTLPRVGRSVPTQKLQSPCSLILIGASTGGPKAVTDLLSNMPSNTPPIVIVQHLDWQFQESFLSRLCLKSGLQNGSLAQDSILRPGHIYVPLTNDHIGVERKGAQWHLKKISAPPMHRCKPAVDVLFSSVLSAQNEVFGVLMTGMGKDGAQGLKWLQSKGSLTFAQDEASSVVWGMPGEAHKLAAVDFMGTPQEIRSQILSLLSSPVKKVSGI